MEQSLRRAYYLGMSFLVRRIVRVASAYSLSGGALLRHAARRPCRMPGCPALVERDFCPAHVPAVRAERSASRRGYGRRWERYTRWFKRQPGNVICRDCRRAPTQCVDHIVPVSGPDDPRFWEPGNHQGLCHSCHNRKTATIDGGFGRAKPRHGGLRQEARSVHIDEVPVYGGGLNLRSFDPADRAS